MVVRIKSNPGIRGIESGKSRVGQSVIEIASQTERRHAFCRGVRCKGEVTKTLEARSGTNNSQRDLEHTS